MSSGKLLPKTAGYDSEAPAGSESEVVNQRTAGCIGRLVLRVGRHFAVAKAREIDFKTAWQRRLDFAKRCMRHFCGTCADSSCT